MLALKFVVITTQTSCIYAYVRQCSIKFFILKEGVLGFKKRFSGFSPSLEEQGMLLGMGKRARQPLEGNGGSISYYEKSDVSNNNTVGWTFHFSIPFTTTRC